MVENITIVDKNGNGIIATGIMHFEMKDTAKKYICYTLNETTSEDQVKIYVAETGDTVGVAGPIDDVVWKEIKKIMVSIAHKEDINNIQLIRMSGGTFFPGEVRKLQVQKPIQQAMMDYQAANIMNVSNINVTNDGSKPVFFDANITQETTDVPAIETPAVNAFSMTAEQQAIEQEESAPLTNIVTTYEPQPVIDEPAVSVEPVSETPVPNIIDTRVNMIVQENVLQPEPTLEPPVEIAKTAEQEMSSTEMSHEQMLESVNIITELMQEANSKMQEANKKIIMISEYLKNKTTKLENTSPIISEDSVSAVVEETQNVINTVETPQMESTFVENISTPNTVIDVAAPQIIIETPQPVIEQPQTMESEPIVVQTTGIIDPITTVPIQPESMIVQPVVEEPVINEMPANQESVTEPIVSEVLQPASMPPVDFSIPDVTPTIEPVQTEEYVHVAQGNNSAAVINYNDYQVQDMPAVEMPLNYQNIDEAKSKMLEQGNLGPSGLSEDPQKTLGLVA